MKKLVALLLMIAMLICTGSCAIYAESTSAYTVDELAYTAYCEIGAVYYSSIRHLETLGGLWESLADKTSWDDVDAFWVYEYWLADGDFDEAMQRGMFLNAIGEKKLGVDNVLTENMSALVDAIRKEAAARHLTDPKSAVFILLAWGQEAGRLKKEETYQAELQLGMEVIRTLMKLDADDAYLDTLKDYYKEASAIHKYMADFSDTYLSFTSKLKQYQESYDSWEIEFDFIFGTDSYETYGDAYSRFLKEWEAQAQ